jgi:PAS domain S-box-containing protein
MSLVLAWVGVGLLYVGVARLGLLLAFAGANVSPLWPPAGLALATLLVGGWRLAPGVVLGAIMTNALDLPWTVVLPVAAGNVGEALLGAYLFTRLGGTICLTTIRGAGALVAAAGISALVSASSGIGGLAVSGLVQPDMAFHAWLTWWSGDAIGMLLVTPVLLTGANAWWGSQPAHAPARRWEMALLILLGSGLGGLCFLEDVAGAANLPLAFLLFPLAVWTTLRLGLGTASLLTAILATVAILGTGWQHGPFADFATLNQRLLALQALLVSLSITVLVLGTVLNERQAAEGELRLAAASVAKAHDLILWIDDRNRVVHANPAAMARLGRTAEELVGQPMKTIADDLESGSWRHSHQHAVVQESTLIAADGTRIPVEVSITRVADPGLPGHYTCAIARDLTERKAMDQQMAQMAKMEALGRLAGGVAHDFNNVLAIIIGYAETAKRRASVPETVLTALGHIHTAGERAAGMTRQLLAFSRQQTLAPRRIDLVAVTRESLPLLERLIGSQVRVTLDHPEHPVPVMADPSQVQQVLMNMAANARDAMPDGGQLAIHLAPVEVDAAEARRLAEANRHDAAVIRPGSFVRLRITDTGEGMSPAVRQRLFEPFFTTKDPGKGTGLGLSSVHGIVIQSGGFITVDSQPGQGTTFTIHLPLAPGAMTDPTRRFLRPQEGGGRRILVVDDQAEVRELVATILREAGHTVEAVGDAPAALAAAEVAAPDLLVTDLVMPGMGGRDLAVALQRRLPDLGVVLMSGFPRGQLDEALPPHTRFIAKPFHHEALLNAVTDVVAR